MSQSVSCCIRLELPRYFLIDLNFSHLAVRDLIKPLATELERHVIVLYKNLNLAICERDSIISFIALSEYFGIFLETRTS